jgi:hypothetical protein
MATRATSTTGVLLKRGDGLTPETFFLVSQLHSWSGPNETAKQIDVSSFDSLAHEYIPGLFDGGEVSFDFYWDPVNAQQVNCRNDLHNRTKRNFTVTLNDSQGIAATLITFTAVVISWGIKGTGIDTAVDGSASLKITGVPTLTPAT